MSTEYKLVPVEPTREMWDAIDKYDNKAYAGGNQHGASFEDLWAVALDAAPVQPAGAARDNSPDGVRLEVFEIVCKERDALQSELVKERELLASIFEKASKSHMSHSVFLLKTEMSAIARSIDPVAYWQSAPAAKDDNHE